MTPLLAPLPVTRMCIIQRPFTAFHSTPRRFSDYTRSRSSKYNIRELKDATVSERAAAEIAIAHGFQRNRCLMMTANHDPVYSVAVARCFLTAALLEGTTHVAEDSAGKIVGAVMSFGPGTEFLHTTRQKEEALAPLLACLDNKTSRWLTNEFMPEYSALLDSALGPGTLLDSWHLQLVSIHPDHACSGIGKQSIQEAINQARSTHGPGVTMTVEPCSGADSVAVMIPYFSRLGFTTRGHTFLKGVSGQVEGQMWSMSWEDKLNPQ